MIPELSGLEADCLSSSVYSNRGDHKYLQTKDLVGGTLLKVLDAGNNPRLQPSDTYASDMVIVGCGSSRSCYFE